MSTATPWPRAAALSYNPDRGAPRVVAKGRGELAERILEAARAAGVPVARSPDLLSLLMQIDIDRHIPEDLYRAVAEVLVWAYEISPAGARRRSEPS